ncbi:GPP34 family phosphoprotein [Streptomyces sp. DSM 41972]|uniref:GPP34 family phosphoprotein n=1 Tax=Streptomyces althioticus subsp. attaecolombicae TaxID=3075534 RepID=A0ABU3HVM8_9ACTN|nr:GPP34 family phosphoprotein [Streptomyces sp. DSM 41972]SCD76649.1 Golgi phosphoprotein 3 (GPP34) [Streptomyces sp. di50b]SCE51376.1 Golgi phosphoprotein 3 (GPP34) [Streptomyces sp. di188]
MPNGPLSLPARLCLLARDLDPTRAAPVVRAGALADLARRGLLVDDDGIATPRDLDSRTGDPALDGLLELVSESFPHDWRTWVTLHARHTLDAVREHLVAEGVLRAEKHRVLGVFPSVDHVLVDRARADALRTEAHQVLSGAAVPDGTTATTLILAMAADLPLPASGTVPAVPTDPGLTTILHELKTGLRGAVPAASLPNGR